MARRSVQETPPVDQATIDASLAYTVAEGDIVNFRFLFFAYSPLREDSTEDVGSPKYAYLLPSEEDEENPRYKEALAMAKTVEMHARVQKELQKDGPVQLPAELVLMLADNAVRLGRYANAAQAYELLRIRRRMQEGFYTEADAALDANDVPKAVLGYLIATALEYDYAAFPEPLPVIPDFPARALLLHAEYPYRPEDCVALQPPEALMQAALGYLLLSAEAASRLESRGLEQCLAFLEVLVRQRDPEWDAFVTRYKEARDMAVELVQRLQREAEREGEPEPGGLAQEIEQQRSNQALLEVPAKLLGRSIENGEWWQYLKELAYKHPGAVLFVSRQAATKDLEIIMPRHARDCPLAKRLGLLP